MIKAIRKKASSQRVKERKLRTRIREISLKAKELSLAIELKRLKIKPIDILKDANNCLLKVDASNFKAGTKIRLAEFIIRVGFSPSIQTKAIDFWRKKFKGSKF